MANTAHEEGTLKVVQEQEHAALLSGFGGVFYVTDADGNLQFIGDEVGAEFAYWRTAFGVPVDDEEVVL